MSAICLEEDASGARTDRDVAEDESGGFVEAQSNASSQQQQQRRQRVVSLSLKLFISIVLRECSFSCQLSNTCLFSRLYGNSYITTSLRWQLFRLTMHPVTPVHRKRCEQWAMEDDPSRNLRNPNVSFYIGCVMKNVPLFIHIRIQNNFTP